LSTDVSITAAIPSGKPGAATRFYTEQQRLLILEQDRKAAQELAELLFSLFVSDSDEDSPLKDDEFVDSLTSSLGLDLSVFRTTLDNVRSGKTTSADAARHIVRISPPSAEDMAKAESVVKQFAQKGNPLLELIASKESGGDYNIVFGGGKMNLTTMTVDQVIAWQEKCIREGADSSACGKYQIINSTLEGLKKELAEKGEGIGNKPYDPAMQERLGMMLLERRGYADYKAGRLSESAFMANVAQEWAAMPKNLSGAGHYDGDGLNKALVKPAVALLAIRAAKDVGDSLNTPSALQTQFAQGGVPQSPSSVGSPSVPFNNGGVDQTTRTQPAKFHFTLIPATTTAAPTQPK
jgi:muramidase (phage lysozyme)